MIDMTKKEEKQQTVNPNNDKDLEELQSMLDDVKEQDEKKSEWKNDDQIAQLLAEIIKLKTQLDEKDEIVKNAQLAYIRTKNDMEMIQRQSAMKAETMHQDLLIKIVKKLLPFVEDLRKSLATLSDDQKESSMWKWVQMVYDKFIKALSEFSIFPIPSMNETPDTKFHEPIGMLPTEDKKLKWKIIQVFEQGFYYQNDAGDKITIMPSKVIIGE